jgi:hypothetical protein
MSQNTQPEPKQILELVQIKSWYIPANAETYRALRDIKVPLLKVHRDFLPTLQLATQRAKLRVRARKFSDILDAYLDKIGANWMSKKGRKCRLNPTRLVFTAPLTLKNKEAVARLDVALATFFERWGHRYVPIYSTEGDRLKLVVDYGFDPQRNPVIRTVEVDKSQAFEFQFGFTKIKFTFHDAKAQQTATRTRALPRMIQLEVFTQAGSDWVLAHTSTCVDGQIGDPSQFMAAMGVLFERFTHES